jgi:hypothetical protein
MATNTFKVCWGRNIESAIAFKKGLPGEKIKRDERRAGNSQIISGFALNGSRVLLPNQFVSDTHGGVIRRDS